MESDRLPWLVRAGQQCWRRWPPHSFWSSPSHTPLHRDVGLPSTAQDLPAL